jgi:hypothetical protein
MFPREGKTKRLRRAASPAFEKRCVTGLNFIPRNYYLRMILLFF